MGASDRYCLRWNNHQANLLSVMDDLLKHQTLTDVTLGVEDGRFLKCHKVILATCSPYFRTLFIEVPSNHPIILLKDVRYTEVKAILEYMYKGEVSVAYDDMDALFQVAELLQVKGLVAGNEVPSGSQPVAPPSPTVCSTSSNYNGETSRYSDNSLSSSGQRNSGNVTGPIKTPNEEEIGEPKLPIPGWPMSPFFPADEHKSAVAALANFHPFLAAQSFPFSQFNENLSDSASSRNPSNNGSNEAHQDPSILRSVLNPEQDSPMLKSPLVRQNSRDSRRRSRKIGSTTNDDRRSSFDSLQTAPSPHGSEPSVMEDEDKRTTGQTLAEDTKYGVSSYGGSQKQEIKRYKKYEPEDVWDAIAAVKGGLSANKAAELFRVPSRTLYDRIKKLGIPPTRHRRSENTSNVGNVQYDLGGNSSAVGMENTAKSTSDSNENPVSMAEATSSEIREKSNRPENTFETGLASPVPRVSSANSQPPSPSESRFKDDTEAQDLTVSRRSNIIVSPNNAIQETS
ncbi:protein tramtrack, beta isoform-like [Venturia canescens]|uniref:protein tramtrack, beta isoform-like n=1 Tax=Venturia canescens TaxID=32260 RepID=UPI001C9BE76E|nr:protein tramtrack, beta isoform-like [Venturia canescens]